MIFRKLAIAAMMASATAAFAAGNPSASNQDSSTVKQAQQALNDKGFNVGAADGIAGPKTQAALEKFQQSKGISGSGTLDSQTLAALGVSGDASASSSTTASSSSSSFSPTMDTASTQSSTATSPSTNQPSTASSTSQPSTSPSTNQPSSPSTNQPMNPATSPSTNQPPSVNQPSPQSYGNK